jgi:uncharacterized membrane protein
MESVEKSVEVECPVGTVYNQWTQFEEFPRFMENVKRVTQLDDQRLHWEAEIGGKTKEWDARITDQIPDQLIAWQSEGGEYNSGTVKFSAVGSNTTRIDLRVIYDPDGFLESAADAVGIVANRVQNDLERFKDFIEHRGEATGAWRGTIRE